ncbi:hypothetical protein HMPREF1986_02040 [Oribacterium sp. oral taxon 078 str. F0263]|nr:hypothetical protein GCWU000341_01944 [Oribacterium sp. oral taxon 078 str. F0262]ERL20671.1 hypothetical protein HMPREF1986_02040 [Oribacterium sp. oral taxon 078 str. F0263]
MNFSEYFRHYYIFCLFIPPFISLSRVLFLYLVFYLFPPL